jgi:rod shape determining protein RodA
MKLFKPHEVNYALILPIFLLFLLSIAVQYGASLLDGADPRPVVLRQLFFCILAAIALWGGSLFSTTFLLRFSGLFYLLSLGLMTLLYWFYDPIMFELTHTKRWMRIGSFTLQPSEIMKLAFVLFMVYLTLLYEKKQRQRTIKSDCLYVGKILLYSLPTFLLMFMQRDFGTSLVFIVMLGALFVISGVHWKLLTAMFSLLAVVGGLLLLLVFTDWGNTILFRLHFKPYQLDRVKAWADPFAFQDSIAYQQVQSIWAIGSGGLLGTNAGHQSVYVPVRESDMIFTVIGETFGFLGSSLVIFLYFYLIYQIIFAALRTNNKAAVYLSITFVFGLVFQIFENIGAAIGLLPLTGIPLPFLSQGGTALIAIGLSLGIILGLEKNDSHEKSALKK